MIFDTPHLFIKINSILIIIWIRYKLLPFFKLVRFMYTLKCIQFKILWKKRDNNFTSVTIHFCWYLFWKHWKWSYDIIPKIMMKDYQNIYYTIRKTGQNACSSWVITCSLVAMRLLICSNRFTLLRTPRTELLLKILLFFYNRVLGNGA